MDSLSLTHTHTKFETSVVYLQKTMRLVSYARAISFAKKLQKKYLQINKRALSYARALSFPTKKIYIYRSTCVLSRSQPKTINKKNIYRSPCVQSPTPTRALSPVPNKLYPFFFLVMRSLSTGDALDPVWSMILISSLSLARALSLFLRRARSLSLSPLAHPYS